MGNIPIFQDSCCCKRRETNSRLLQNNKKESNIAKSVPNITKKEYKKMVRYLASKNRRKIKKNRSEIINNRVHKREISIEPHMPSSVFSTPLISPQAAISSPTPSLKIRIPKISFDDENTEDGISIFCMTPLSLGRSPTFGITTTDCEYVCGDMTPEPTIVELLMSTFTFDNSHLIKKYDSEIKKLNEECRKIREEKYKTFNVMKPTFGQDIYIRVVDKEYVYKPKGYPKGHMLEGIDPLIMMCPWGTLPEEFVGMYGYPNPKEGLYLMMCPGDKRGLETFEKYL